MLTSISNLRNLPLLSIFTCFNARFYPMIILKVTLTLSNNLLNLFAIDCIDHAITLGNCLQLHWQTRNTRAVTIYIMLNLFL